MWFFFLPYLAYRFLKARGWTFADDGIEAAHHRKQLRLELAKI